MPRCFVIMPISTPIESVSDYGDDPDHFAHVLCYLFKPALERAGYDMVPPFVSNSQIIQAEIIRNIETADLVLCDISEWNANVFFELGIRVALDRPVALVKDSKTPAIPFDNALVSCHTYDSTITPWCLDAEIEKLAEFVQAAGAQERNALWQYFGITQRASIPAAGDPVHEKLDLILSSLAQWAEAKFYTTEIAALPRRERSTILLTPQELQIALIVADGATNVHASAQLRLSAKTIEFHLSNIYRKLGIRSRAQLARWVLDTSPPSGGSEACDEEPLTAR